MVTTWFGEKERGLAIAICTLAVPMGVMIGMAYGSIYITKDDATDIETGKVKVCDFLFHSSIVVGAFNWPILFAMCCIKEKPTNFPSKIAKEQSLYKSEHGISVISELQTLVKRKNVIVFTLSYMNIYSM